MVSYTVKQTVVENLNADLDGKQPAGDYPTNASLTESLQSNLFNYTTNRILEIPQDIKLELNNGTLTLKAGSKVYVPNEFETDGTTPKFDVVTIENDVQLLSSLTSTYTDGDYSWCYNKDLNKIQGGNNKYKQIQSQTYDSSARYCMFYDTTNNIIKYTADSGATWESGYSLPFCLSQLKSGKGLTSIDQVFNGFGYIGSTLFALPGIKCQFADGRNEDGTLKSFVKTIDNIIIRNNLEAETGEAICFIMDGIEPYAVWMNNYHISTTQPNDQECSVWFDGKKFYKKEENGEWKQKNLIPALRYSVNQGKVTRFAPSDVNSINCYSRADLSSLGMPGTKYIDLTLGASGATYTAPANGWFTLHKGANSVGQYVYMYTTGIDIGTCFNVSSGTDIPSYFLPVKAGDTVKIDYTLGGTTKQFRFIYSKGYQ